MEIIKKLYNAIKTKYFLLAASGVVCAVLQSSAELAPAAFVSYAPMMYLLCSFEGRRELVKRFGCFFVPYYFYQLVFLLTVYRQIEMKRPPAVLLLLLAVIVLTVWESILMLMPVLLFAYLRRGGAFDVVVLSLLIASGEWLEENIFVLSFPWSAVWLSVTGMPVALQTANLLGCRIVTALLLSFNGFAAFAVMHPKRIRAAAGAAAVLGIMLGYGFYSVSAAERAGRDSPQIKVLIAQDEKEGSKKSGCSALDCARSYSELITSQNESADLIVLPETAVPTSYDESAAEFDIISRLAKNSGAAVVNGCFFRLDGDGYNALYAAQPQGKASRPYLKQVLVPFGERVPLASLFGVGTLCECSDEEYTRPLETDIGKVGCAICIESIYPTTVHKQAFCGAQLLCVCTNDSWFGSSYARKMHFRHSIMRAVENGRYLLRSGNCGISAVISPSGKIESIREETTKGVVTGSAALISQKTFYSRTNDLFSVVPAFLTAAAVMKAYTRREKFG